MKFANCFFVEMEGFEPSSKRGTNKLSTCLVMNLSFRDTTGFRPPIISLALKVRIPVRASDILFPIFLALPYRNVSERGNRVMSRLLHFGDD